MVTISTKAHVTTYNPLFLPLHFTNVLIYLCRPYFFNIIYGLNVEEFLYKGESKATKLVVMEKAYLNVVIKTIKIQWKCKRPAISTISKRNPQALDTRRVADIEPDVESSVVQIPGGVPVIIFVH